MEEGRPARRRRWPWRLLPVGLWLLCVAGWFVFGAIEGARFDRRLAAMRAEGWLPTLESLLERPPAEGENGAPLLERAEERARELQAAWEVHVTSEGLDGLEFRHPDRWSAKIAEEVDEDPEKAALLRRLARERALRLRPYLDLVEAAARSGHLRATLAEWDGLPHPGTAVIEVMRVGIQVVPALEYLPEERVRGTTVLLDLLERADDPPGSMLVFEAIVWSTSVVAAMRVCLDGPEEDEGLPEAWVSALERGERELLRGLEAQRTYARAAVLWELLHWREGVAPSGTIDEEQGELTASGRDFIDNLLDGVGGAPGWCLTWYGRPWLQHRAHEVLDRLAAQVRGPWDLERLRAGVAVASEDRYPDHVLLEVLRAIAAVRLMRVALGLHAARDPDPGSGGRLDVIRAALAGGLPRDALTDLPFEVHEQGGALLLRCPPGPLLDRLRRDRDADPDDLDALVEEGFAVRLR